MKSFLFSMPPLFAWPLAVSSGIFLWLTAVLVFLGTPLYGLVLYLLLVVPVGVTPLIARMKRRGIWQWTLTVVGLAAVQLAIRYVPSVPLPVLLLHPIIPALALVYERATPPPTPTSNDSETPAGDAPRRRAPERGNVRGYATGAIDVARAGEATAARPPSPSQVVSDTVI